jgi:Flp pilus assembly protein CpaB
MKAASRLISTKRGTLLVAGVAALLAGALILIYLNGYRNSIQSEGAPVTVLVASENIPKGTSGTVIAERHLFRMATMRESQLREGAFSDPANLTGQVATQQIYKGSQLTRPAFGPGDQALTSELTGTDRIVGVPLDSAHGLIGEIEDGSRVDVFAGFNVVPLRADGTPISGGQARAVLKRIITNVPVVQVDTKSGGLGSSSTSKVLLRLTDKQAADLAFASDNGKVWLSLRPGAGAESSPPSLVTVETVLLGTSPLTVLHSFGARR